MAEHNEKMRNALRIAVSAMLAVLIMLNTTYGIHSIVSKTNEFIGTTSGGEPIKPKPPTPPKPSPPKPTPPAPSPPTTNIVPPEVPGTTVPNEPITIPPSEIPKTGDDTDPAPWLILLTFCAFLLRHILFFGKKSNY